MTQETIATLVRRIETGTTDQPELAQAVMAALLRLFPDAGVTATALTSTEAALALVCRAFPGWRIELHGEATPQAGAWACTLREGGTRDDDEAIGIGRCATIPLALLAAMMLAAARRERDPA